MEHQQPTVEEFAHLDATACVAAATAAGRKVDRLAAERDGVVEGNHPRVAASEDAIEPTGCRTPRRARITRSMDQGAGVEAGHESRQESGGSFEGVTVVQLEFGGQPVL